MFVITMTIFKFPYAILTGVLIAFTALIPIFGAFIGCVIGAFLILIVSPVQAFWFIVMFIILQQIEGNLIYPYVVGNSVGLPSIWVLVAVTLGGNLMGIPGMLLFIPMFSVLYTLMREFVYKRLRERRINREKWKNGKAGTPEMPVRGSDSADPIDWEPGPSAAGGQNIVSGGKQGTAADQNRSGESEMSGGKEPLGNARRREPRQKTGRTSVKTEEKAGQPWEREKSQEKGVLTRVVRDEQRDKPGSRNN